MTKISLDRLLVANTWMQRILNTLKLAIWAKGHQECMPPHFGSSHFSHTILCLRLIFDTK